LLVKVLAKQKTAYITYLLTFYNFRGFTSTASKQNPPQSPFKKGGSKGPPPLKKGEAKVLPFCKGELEGISYTVLAQGYY
jgi:hypothetical protein